LENPSSGEVLWKNMEATISSNHQPRSKYYAGKHRTRSEMVQEQSQRATLESIWTTARATIRRLEQPGKFLFLFLSFIDFIIF
jgi:hypothetical protein